MRAVDMDQIRTTVDLAAPVARVWRALTDHREFGHWFGVELEQSFRVGAETTGHITQPGDEHVRWSTITERMDRESVFAFSWPPGDVDPDTDYPDHAKVLVEFHLEPRESGTRLTIVESGFSVFPESKRLDILGSNTEGWMIQAENVKRYVEA